MQFEQLGSQGAHCVSTVVVHAAVWYVPAGHDEHRLHAVPLSQRPALQLAHALEPAPVHVAHVPSQLLHTVFDVGVHAVASYLPAGQVAHVAQLVPLRYRGRLQLVHAFDPAPLQVAHVALQAAHAVSLVPPQAAVW